ncbi:MAG TPA: hypothetical protein VIU12_17575 [Chryseolinea sp.]
MTDQANKPKGTFAKLMSSSHIQEDQKGVSGKPETLKSVNQEIGNPGIPETPKPGIRDFLKAKKYSTQLHPDLIKRLKQYATTNEEKDYEVLEAVDIKCTDVCQG